MANNLAAATWNEMELIFEVITLATKPTTFLWLVSYGRRLLSFTARAKCPLLLDSASRPESAPLVLLASLCSNFFEHSPDLRTRLCSLGVYGVVVHHCGVGRWVTDLPSTGAAAITLDQLR